MIFSLLLQTKHILK